MGSRVLKTHLGGIGKQGAGGEAGGGRWASLSTVLQCLLLIVLTDVPVCGTQPNEGPLSV